MMSSNEILIVSFWMGTIALMLIERTQFADRKVFAFWFCFFMGCTIL